MDHGTVVVLVVSGEAGKPRPAVVVQRASSELARLSTVLVVPCTSELSGLPLRPLLRATPSNGLRQTSAAMVDRLQAVDRSRVRERIGLLSTDDMASVEAALALVLGL